MNEERIIYRKFGKEIYEGTQVKIQGVWWRRPDFELLRVCKDEEEAEAMLRELRRYSNEKRSSL